MVLRPTWTAMAIFTSGSTTLGPGTGGRVDPYLMLNDGTGRFTIVAQAGPGIVRTAHWI